MTIVSAIYWHVFLVSSVLTIETGLRFFRVSAPQTRFNLTYPSITRSCLPPLSVPFSRLSKRLVGAVDEYDGDRFFTKLGGKGKTVATPLLLCLVCIELSDFVFAVDSIPAVLGVSQVRVSTSPGPATCVRLTRCV